MHLEWKSVLAWGGLMSIAGLVGYGIGTRSLEQEKQLRLAETSRAIHWHSEYEKLGLAFQIVSGRITTTLPVRVKSDLLQLNNRQLTADIRAALSRHGFRLETKFDRGIDINLVGGAPYTVDGQKTGFIVAMMTLEDGIGAGRLISYRIYDAIPSTLKNLPEEITQDLLDVVEELTVKEN